MLDTRFNCLPTMIGSMPHTDAEKAGEVVCRYLKEIPAWPQMPDRSFLEHMNVQFSEGFPGLMVKGKRVYVDRTAGIDEAMDKLYNAYLAGETTEYIISKEYAAGLHNILSSGIKPLIMKGQITGPVTWGLSITEENKKAILYDDMFGDAVPKFLRLKASWQEKELRKISKNTIVFLDEPYMTSFGSATVPLSGEIVTGLLNDVFKGISGLKGIHCCGNTDWPVLFSTDTNIVSFDAYNYAHSLSLYPNEVKKFLDRNGVIAWGIVPNTENALLKETVSSLKDRLEGAMFPFTKKGIPMQKLVEQGLLTPSCGLAGLTADVAERSLELLAELSLKIRNSYI